MSSVVDLLLGPAGHQRVRAGQVLLSLAVYLALAVVQQVEVAMGFIDPEASAWLTIFNVGGALLFFGVVRSGLNLRLSRSDPALTVHQMMFALSGISWSYAISGPARGAVMSIMMLVVLFGMFSLPERDSRRITLAGFLMLGGVMAYKGLFDPGAYDPKVDLLHLLFAAIVLAAVSQLAVRLGRLRQRLRAQKVELQAALERIRELATRDPLTGLLNRRAMAEVLHTQAGDRRVETDGLSLALIDLDHFKRINDSHGHAVGDQVLQHFAVAATATLRTGDILSRWGGEEFLLVLPGTTPAAAMVCIERIRERLRAEPFAQVQAPFVVGFSCGVSACQGLRDIEAAVDRADQAMYRAKAGGRNRSLAALETGPAAPVLAPTLP